MEINLTIIGQTLEFILFVWLCLKFVWPPIMSALENRQKDISDGLKAAEDGRRSLELAEKNAAEQLVETKKQAQDIIEQANRRKSKILDEAREEATDEKSRILTQAREEIESEANKVREKLRKEAAELAVLGAEKILKKNVDKSTTSGIIDELLDSSKKIGGESANV